jgi:inorganic pyrophosphatase
MNPWHEVEIGNESPIVVNALIEIPRNSKTKFELDKKSGLLKVDRVLYSSVHYPANYGFIPQTYCGDNDPLDIFVLGQAEVYPLSIMRARPIGYMRMLDQGEADDKIIAVHADDPEIYKTLENKIVVVDEFYGIKDSYQIIEEAKNLYQKMKHELIQKK